MTHHRYILFSPRIINQDIFPSVAIGSDLVEYIFETGFIPIVIPYSKKLNDAQLTEIIKKYVEIADGVVLLGGKDIHSDLHEVRDKFEYYLVQQAVAGKKGIFGICRGMQMINLAHGGTLIDDLGDRNFLHVGTKSKVENLRKIDIEQASDREMHGLVFEKGSKLKPNGSTTFRVNSIHHQAIDKLGKNLIIEAKSDDGVIEIIRDASQKILGVQFHPEIDLTNPLYRHIIDYWLKNLE